MSSEIRIILPAHHAGQQAIVDGARRWTCIAAGRRFGKTLLCIELDLNIMLQGKPVAWFAPTYKMLADTWREFKRVAGPVIEDKSETEHRIKLVTGGTLDMWSLEDSNAGRGRKYARAVVDEAAMTPNLEEAWTEAIRPTLSDYQGDGFFPSTPKGRNYFHRMYSAGVDPEQCEWASFHMPTSVNPYIAPEEIEAARAEMPERAFLQEYMAEFIEESGGVFRCVVESIDAGRCDNTAEWNDAPCIMGVDLARTADFTVLTVLDLTGRQIYFERYNQISWERQIADIERVAKRFNAYVIIDSTGVGDPIYERIRKAGIAVEGFVFTANSKEQLIDGLAMKLESGALRLMDIPTQANELMAYQYELTPSRHVRMNAPAGFHDDTVIALALAASGLREQFSPDDFQSSGVQRESFLKENQPW